MMKYGVIIAMSILVTVIIGGIKYSADHQKEVYQHKVKELDSMIVDLGSRTLEIDCIKCGHKNTRTLFWVTDSSKKIVTFDQAAASK